MGFSAIGGPLICVRSRHSDERHNCHTVIQCALLRVWSIRVAAVGVKPSVARARYQRGFAH
eukprot:3276081-Lingulodinium_polyedra.AAC.1